MYERLVGLHVVNDEDYHAYRQAMTPILGEHGGDFGFDFRVSKALINPSGHPINRVFTIRFPDEATCQKFFANPRYLEAKAKFFDKAVEGATVIAAYER